MLDIIQQIIYTAFLHAFYAIINNADPLIDKAISSDLQKFKRINLLKYENTC